ncbi:MAG TPA: ABC transporter permease [Candidatus Methanoperedenaceae archaeon]|nr:ABC transporter permease [Candidatus Methanoperedenaceae archaeon]
MLALRTMLRSLSRTILSVSGIALAVLSIIIIASIGNGIVATGGKTLEASRYNLWVTGKPADLQSQYMGGSETKVTFAHTVARDIGNNSSVSLASPVLAEMVYAYREGTEMRTLFALGIENTRGPGESKMISISAGKDLLKDTHYAGGRYDGAWSREVLIDGRTAGLLGAGVGDTIHIGKTVSEAEAQEFTVVGITNSLSMFSSSPMVILYLSELQDITGNKYQDSASMVMVRLKPGADAKEIAVSLRGRYPQYRVSTNTEFFAGAVRQNALPVAGAASIVVLAVVSGATLCVINMLLSLNSRRKELAVLLVLGFSRWSIIKRTFAEGLLVSISGCAVALVLSMPLVSALNWISQSFTGIQGLVSLEPDFMYLGIVLSAAIGILTGVASALWVRRMRPLDVLRSV